jgi:MFS family permease
VHSAAFSRLLTAWGVSLFGDGVRLVALPLVAALLTGNPLAVTAVAAAELVPWLLFSLPAGALVDRSDPRRALILAHLCRAALTAVLVAALLTGRASVVVLATLALLLTVAETVADAAAQVLLVAVAGEDDLLVANARVRTVESVTFNLGGPLVGGALVALQPALAFAVNGVTFLVAAAVVSSLPASTGAATVDAEPAASLLASVREGVRALWAVPGLRLLVSVTAWTSLATGAVNAITTLFALQVLALPVAAVPVLVVVEALGLLLGARLVRLVVARRTDGSVMAMALVLVGGAYLVIGLVPVTAVVLVCYLINGLGFAWWNVLASARRQRLTPVGLLGRVSNASRAISWGAMPLGAVAGGVLATVTSLQQVYVVGGGVVLVVALLARRALVASGLPTRPADGSAPAT